MKVDIKLAMIVIACVITFIAARRPLREIFGEGPWSVVAALAVAGLAFFGFTSKGGGTLTAISSAYVALAVTVSLVVVGISLFHVFRSPSARHPPPDRPQSRSATRFPWSSNGQGSGVEDEEANSPSGQDGRDRDSL